MALEPVRLSAFLGVKPVSLVPRVVIVSPFGRTEPFTINKCDRLIVTTQLLQMRADIHPAFYGRRHNRCYPE